MALALGAARSAAWLRVSGLPHIADHLRQNGARRRGPDAIERSSWQTAARPMRTAPRCGGWSTLVQPVQWVRSIQYLREQGVDSVIEFGPGRVLTGLAKRIDRSIGVRNVSDLASARSEARATPTPP
jgi:hypothetical protein